MCEHLRALGDAELLRLRQRYFAIAPGALAFGCAASQRPGCETCHLTLGDDAMVCLQCGATRHFLSSSCCVRLSVRNARSLQDIAGAGDARTSKRPRIRRDGTCFCTCWKAITGSPRTARYVARPLVWALFVFTLEVPLRPRARGGARSAASCTAISAATSCMMRASIGFVARRSSARRRWVNGACVSLRVFAAP